VVFFLQAFMDHGTVARTVDQDLDEAHAVLQKLKEVRTAHTPAVPFCEPRQSKSPCKPDCTDLGASAQ
jgi:hypothetical protein